MDPVIHLLHACKDGDLAQVKEMIQREKVDVNVTFYFRPHKNSNHEILDATPLFIAAGKGHIKVCQYLVGIGANVNYLTTKKSKMVNGESKVNKLSPLHAVIESCSFRKTTFLEGNKATIEFLMANGADISILPLINGIPRPIWILSKKKDAALALLLIELGLIQPSLSWCPKLGCTVLHFWAFGVGTTNDAVPIFKNLLAKGADLNVIDNYGLTPLHVAIFGCRPAGNPNNNVLRYLLYERDDISLSDKIEALELAGASILLFKEDQESTDRAFQHWYEAQDLRDNAKEPIIPKTSLNADMTIPWRSAEWTTRDELDQLKLRPQAEIKMQAFLVTRRFLVRISSSFLVPYLWNEFVRNYVSVILYRENRFTELLDICWLMLDGTSKCQEPASAEGYWRMVVEVNYWIVNTLMELKKLQSPILNLETLKLSLKLVFDSNNRSPYLSSATTNRWGNIVIIRPMQTLFNVVHKVLSESSEMMTPEVNSLLIQFVQRDSRDRHGYNLLLLTCHYNVIISATLASVRLLLKVGADPNAKTKKGISPLHFAARFMKKGDMNSPLADLLLEYGAHLDHTDDRQQTPLDVWKERNADGEADGGVLTPPAWLNPVHPLKCYCARAIQRSNIPYEEDEQLPIKSLRDFVAEH